MSKAAPVREFVYVWCGATVYPKKYAHGLVVLCFVVVMQSFIMNSHEAFIHIHQGCFSGTGAIVRLPQCQWSKPDGYGKISQCITTTKHSKAKTVCIFLGIYCSPCMRPTYTCLVSYRDIVGKWRHMASSTCVSIGSWNDIAYTSLLLNKCWIIVHWTFKDNLKRNMTNVFTQENALKYRMRNFGQFVQALVC